MIKVADINDITKLEILINSAYRGESGRKGWTTESDILSGIRIDSLELFAIINSVNSTIFKYELTDVILGCVLLEEKIDKLYLGMFCVSPTEQNSGIGKKILQFATNFAISKGLPKIVMTVIATRTELIDWYKRHDFVDSGKREPFPDGYEQYILSGETLEFMVLEKQIC